MKLIFAPLEGITNYVYRNTVKEMFGFCDEYYSPFITPSEDDKVNRKGLKDIIPENNPDITIKPQVLTQNSDAFLRFTEKITAVGYNEVNLNFGCPSQTVVKKGKGSGFLKEPYKVDEFLGAVFEKKPMKISVKTRTGFWEHDEMDSLMDIYNKYPLEILIIHPRTRNEFYGGVPNMEVFKIAYEKSVNPVCYNGNIESCEDFKALTEAFPDICHVMIGRGAVKNPAIFREIRGGDALCRDELVELTKRLCENYQRELNSETFTLNKLKEVWMYMIQNYPEEKKILKLLKKANKVSDFISAVNMLPEIHR